MNGIDVSSNQPANIGQMVSYDFMIVKATGNPQGFAWDYKNEFMDAQVNDALTKTGCAGLYHFTYGTDAVREADLFLDKVKPYVGKVILVIDYEGKGALKQGRSWLQKMIQRIKERTNIPPVVYASSSVVHEQGLMEMLKAENCGLWCANYYLGNQIINGYDTSGMEIGVPDSMLWQYTGTGRLPGYGSDLDLDVFFGDRDAWMAYATGDGAAIPVPVTPTFSVDDLAKQVIAGQWGNDQDRKQRLTAAGYDYQTVQNRVNELVNPVRVYVVQNGDTLSQIGSQLGIPWKKLAQDNGIPNPNLIYPGQQIRY